MSEQNSHIEDVLHDFVSDDDAELVNALNNFENSVNCNSQELIWNNDITDDMLIEASVKYENSLLTMQERNSKNISNDVITISSDNTDYSDVEPSSSEELNNHPYQLGCGKHLCRVCLGQPSTSTTQCTCQHSHTAASRKSKGKSKNNSTKNGNNSNNKIDTTASFRCRVCKSHVLASDCVKARPAICNQCYNRRKRRSALYETVSEIDLPIQATTEEATDVRRYFHNNQQAIENIIEEYRQRFRSIRVNIRLEASFTHQTENEIIQRKGYFGSMAEEVSEGYEFNIGATSSELINQIDRWTTNGSGFVLDIIDKVTVGVSKFRPLHGSSYIPTPQSIERKKCVVNIYNPNDDKCFLWSILASIHPVEQNPNRLSYYSKYENSLNTKGLSFPLQVKQIPLFEHQNPSISVNVLCIGENEKEFCPLYVSRERGRQHHVNLLLIESNDRRHYVLIKHMSRLVARRTKSKAQNYVCNNCLHPFSSAEILQNHLNYCLHFPAQMLEYPNPENKADCTLKFDAFHKQFRLNFYLVADFEAFLEPVHGNDSSNNNTRPIDEHTVSGFACHRMTEIEKYRTPPTVYNGPNPMRKFYEHIFTELSVISSILSENVVMKPLTVEQQTRFNSSIECEYCKVKFNENNRKIRHHSHVSGEYLGSACNRCNLQMKPSKTKNSAEFCLPIIFHNLKNYDLHFVIKNLTKEYLMNNQNSPIKYENINLIPITSEKYMMFQINQLRFLDSFQFLSSSLDDLVQILAKSGHDHFPETVRYLGSNDLVFAGKGVYPYSYMSDESKFMETELPSIDHFYDYLNDEALSVNDYERAKHTWKFYKIKNLGEYHNHYLLSDVLFLSDIFENFRNSVYEKHRLDCLHFFTLPSLAWNMALKHTQIELELLTDPDQYLMIESGIRGGVATISNRYARANNPYLEDENAYDSTKSHTFLTYLDANNLYGCSMSSFPLPISDFRFLNAAEIASFNLQSHSSDAEYGFIIECDLMYPSHLHDSHSDYPLAAEHISVTKNMLSPFALSLCTSHWQPSEKLSPNLMDKQKYVTHYRNLQFYVKHGLVVTKIHRIITFRQKPWLKNWIDYCTHGRQTATSQFESDLFKLQANAVFGKSIENVRNRINVRLIADPDKLLKAVSKLTFIESSIINPDLVLVRAAKSKVKLNRPIYTGFSILELSKLVMYEFFYDYLKPKYNEKVKLMFTDTDSFCCYIETPDLFKDMETDLHLFDTSNFNTQHPLYSTINTKVVGKFKSETGSRAPLEFVGLKAKMYSLLISQNDKPKMVAKGIKKSYIKNHMRHEQYLKTLKTLIPTMSKFRLFRSINHVLQTIEIDKLCLSAFDDKRYILEDGVSTLAYGHYRI